MLNFPRLQLTRVASRKNASSKALLLKIKTACEKKVLLHFYASKKVNHKSKSFSFLLEVLKGERKPNKDVAFVYHVGNGAKIVLGFHNFQLSIVPPNAQHCCFVCLPQNSTPPFRFPFSFPRSGSQCIALTTTGRKWLHLEVSFSLKKTEDHS